MTVEIIKGLLDSVKNNDTVSADGSLEIKEAIRNELNKNGMLEDQALIESKKALNKAKNYEEFLQKEISYYNDLEAKGYVIVDSWHYESLKNSLEDISIKINELESDLKDFEEVIVVEEDLTEETGEVEEEVTEEIVDSEEESEEITEEVTEEVAAGVITLNGTVGDGGNAFPMSMTIDLGTGAVSGMVYIRINFTDLDYKLEVDAPISGSMNLETRGINAQAGELNLTGRLSANGNSANGTASGDDWGGPWSVSR